MKSKKSSVPDLSRRHFIGAACCAAVGATGFLSSLASLRLIGAAASPGNGPLTPRTAGTIASDYKALVCLFLQGGYDANNLIIPSDTTSYAAYAKARSNLALPQTGLLPISPRTRDGRSYSLHPAVPELQAMFASGQAALLGNVGTLVYPTTLAQYKAGSVPLPPQLFSHADQQVQWQSSVPDKPTTTGWGGRLADLVNAFNSNNQISMSISMAGTNFFQVGNAVTQYAVSPNGAVTFSGQTGGNNPIRYQAQKDLFAQSQPGLFDAAFAGISAASIANADFLNTTLANAPKLTTVFPNTASGTTYNSASAQLQMVARLIGAAPSLGLKRQIFFVQLGGWDTHASQLDSTNPDSGTHATLLSDISQALNAFYNATVELGVANQVTAFTASDFGRTFTSNGDGSDHGWGNHQIIVGGAVKGGDIYGSMPSLAIGGPDDTGRGRWVPSTSVDEYAATLATWFGVSATDLPTVLPNIGRFATANLGFV
ncbi:MAG TPA: DUF1501 domain-containing protein [Opitutaceae bacterium]|nr:DUF1501 domain-containing protein [Opitutaceae bacterium]